MRQVIVQKERRKRYLKRDEGSVVGSNFSLGDAIYTSVRDRDNDEVACKS